MLEHDCGEMLLKCVGLRDPDDASIDAAVKANDVFATTLEQIRDTAGGANDNDGGDSWGSGYQIVDEAKLIKRSIGWG
jgi:hypothetical protein